MITTFVAYHEASHVIMAEVLGVRWVRATVVLQADPTRGGKLNLGSVDYEDDDNTLDRWFQAGRDRPSEHLRHALIMVCMAGAIGETLLAGADPDFIFAGAASDRADIERLVGRCRKPPRLDRLHRATAHLIEKHRGRIGDKARELLIHGTV